MALQAAGLGVLAVPGFIVFGSQGLTIDNHGGYINLVGGLKHFLFFHSVGSVIIPTGVCTPPTVAGRLECHGHSHRPPLGRRLVSPNSVGDITYKHLGTFFWGL